LPSTEEMSSIRTCSLATSIWVPDFTDATGVLSGDHDPTVRERSDRRRRLDGGNEGVGETTRWCGLHQRRRRHDEHTELAHLRTVRAEETLRSAIRARPGLRNRPSASFVLNFR